MSGLNTIETKETPTIGEWLEYMQETAHLASIVSATVIDDGKLREIFLYDRELGTYSFSMGVERAVLDIDRHHYPVHSVKANSLSRIGTPSFYRPLHSANDFYQLKDFYREAANYTVREAEFCLSDLVKAYRQPRFKRAIEGFILKDENYRFVTTQGLPVESYRVSLFENSMFLHIWGKNLEVEAVRHTNGVTLIVDNGKIEAYQAQEHAYLSYPQKSAFSKQPQAQPA